MKNILQTSVRAKLIAIVLVGIVLINVCIYAISETVILKSYDDIERSLVVQNVQQTNDAFHSYVTQMSNKIRDWAFWDESFEYAKDPVKNRDFADRQLMDSILTNMQINMIMYVDPEGTILFKKVIDLQTERVVDNSPIPEELIRTEREFLMSKDADIHSYREGIVTFSDGPMIISSVPILPTDSQGPNAGTLIFGKFINAAVVGEVSELTHLVVDAYTVSSTAIPDDVAAAIPHLTADTPYRVTPLSAKKVAGYSTIYDVHGKPSLFVRVERDREIYNQGRATLAWFMITASFSLFLLILAMTLLLNKYIVWRLERLNRELVAIGERKDLSGRVTESNNDEVGNLAKTINTMLSDLNSAQANQEKLRQLEKESAEKLKDRLQEIERINKMMLGREMKMVELKETIKKLGGHIPEEHAGGTQ